MIINISDAERIDICDKLAQVLQSELNKTGRFTLTHQQLFDALFYEQFFDFLEQSLSAENEDDSN